MGLRFFRRIRIAPGVMLNLSNSGVSTSLGTRGAHVTLGHGEVRETVGLPGTGVYDTEAQPPRSVRPVFVWLLIAVIVPALCSGARRALAADDPCAGFKWDVTRERELFAAAPEAVMAGTDVVTAPLLNPNRLYDLAVTPQRQVKFQVAPGKTRPVEGSSAGLARLRLSTAGEYRVSLDQSSWIDLVADDHLVAAEDFQGRPGCQTPHKIVLYSLPSGEELILQLSGAAASHVRLTIVPMPAAPSR